MLFQDLLLLYLKWHRVTKQENIVYKYITMLYIYCQFYKKT